MAEEKKGLAALAKEAKETPWAMLVYLWLQRGVYKIEAPHGPVALPVPEEGDYTAFFEEMCKLIYPPDIPHFRDLLKLYILQQEYGDSSRPELFCQYRMKDFPGPVWVESRVFFTEDGGEPAALIVARDISQGKNAEIAAAMAAKRPDDERYRTVLELTNTVVYEYNGATGERFVSPAIGDFLVGDYKSGRGVLEVFREDRVVHPKDRDKLMAYYRDTWYSSSTYVETTLRLKQKLGYYRWYRLVTTKIYEGQSLRRAIGILTDVDEETRLKLTLQYRAEYDMVTGLYNKETFLQKAAALLAEEPEQRHFIARLDIDRFRVVNELFGQKEGDKVLRHIGRCIQRALQSGGVYGRMQNDVFCICARGGRGRIMELCQALILEIKKYPLPFEIAPSIGIYQVDDLDASVDVMCDWAKLAMGSVKGSVIRHIAFFDEAMRSTQLAEQHILGEMQGALADGQFKLYLQPKYDIGSGHIIGAEALVRWDHPKRGLIPPAQFIPPFERTGFIIKLDEFIWEESCKLLSAWQGGEGTPLPISVNVSRMHLYSTDFADVLVRLLHRYGLEPRLLELELTESAYTENPQQLFATMAKLQGYGFTFLMDDFGSGYSSLNMLKDVPVDILKIDMAFLSGKENVERGRTILEATILMAQRLGLPVIAEGVETKEQAMFLFEAGCNWAQGYYYAKPMPVPEFMGLLRAQRG